MGGKHKFILTKDSFTLLIDSTKEIMYVIE